jgi:hypothetical protein
MSLTKDFLRNRQLLIKECLIKLGALSQLECWNNGIMGSGIRQCWVNGKLCADDKIKSGQYPFKNQSSTIPLFHIRGKRSRLKKSSIFSLSCRNSETF